MTKFMLLEWRKLNRVNIIGETIIYIVILMLMPTFFIKVVLPAFGDSYSAAIELNSYIQMGTILLGGSLINHVFIEEYKNKTMSLAFTYPISRRKLFTAKVLFIACCVFGITMVSFIMSGVATVVLNQFYQIITEPLTASDILAYVSTMVVRSALITVISFVPLFLFGIWKRLVVPLIVCSLLSMQLPNFSSFIHVDPDTIVFVLTALGAISIWLSIQWADDFGEI